MANDNKYTFVWKKAIQKRLATWPSKLIVPKQDVITELGFDVSPMNDELLYIRERD